jgi:elongation factor P
VIFKIIEFQHVKPGKGGAFVRTKIRRISDGAVIDRTFRAGETFRPVRTEARKMTFLYTDDQPSDIQLSASTELEVTHTEPGVKGDTASGGGNKPATLETGAIVNVPLFVNIGDRIKVDTREGTYISRA